MINYNIVTYTKAAVYSIFLPFSQNWSNFMFILVFCVVLCQLLFVFFSFGYSIPGADPGGTPPKIGKNMIFGVQSWFFTRNTPKMFAPSSARRNFFKCAPLTRNPGSAPAFPVLRITSSVYPFGIFKLIYHYYVCFIRLWGQILWLSDIKRYNCAEWTYNW